MLTENGKPRDFSFMRIDQYGGRTACEVYPDFSSLLDAFYARRDREERMRRLSSETAGSVKTLRDRQVRKLAQQRQELLVAADREASAKTAT
jgi:hypothetical protein